MAVRADTLRGMLTLSEAAARLGVSAGMLRQQVHNGRLRAKKVGPVWTLSERELERYRRESLGRPGRPRKDEQS